MNRKAFISLVLAATVVLGAHPSYAASGGRISSGGFRSSSPSRSIQSRPYTSGGYSRPYTSGGYSRPYTSPKISPSVTRYNNPYTTNRRVRVPVTRRDTYVETPRTNTNVIIVPDLTPPITYVNPSQVQMPKPYSPPVSGGGVNPAQVATPSGSPNFLLIFIVIAGTILLGYYLLKSSERNSDPFYKSQGTGGGVISRSDKSVKIVRLRVALLASAKDIKDDLEMMVEKGDTSNEEGLATILQNTTLALLRHPNEVVYASGEIYQGNMADAEQIYNRISMEERSKISEELISNVSGNRKVEHYKDNDCNEYILVSLLVAIESPFSLKSTDSAPNLSDNLIALGAIAPEGLQALEIIWQPEGDKEVLSKEELLSLYPNLVSI